MKLTIKTLRQETFEVELPETETVLILKTKIELISKNEMPANRITLIYAGLILENDKLLKSYNISENKFLVAMVKPVICKVATQSEIDEQIAKDKSTTNFTKNAEDGINSAIKTNNTTITPVNTSTVNPPIVNLPTVNPPSVNPSTVKSSTVNTNINSNQQTTIIPSNTFTSSESLINSEQINHSIQNIVDVMGYPEHDVRRAFEASFNNPDRAVEYLMNGMPTSNPIDDIGINMEAIQRSMNEQRQSNTNRTLSLSSATSPLEFLRTDPNFYQMRMDLRENPDLLETVILHIAETNPSLLNLIVQHQEDFVNIINEPIDGIDNDNNISENEDIIDNEDDDDDDDDEYEPANILNTTNDGQSSLRIYMTPDDLEAINRLTNLGFSEMLCVEAYFACDKNEEQAANLLCSNQMDE